jgi:hypothetical protein
MYSQIRGTTEGLHSTLNHELAHSFANFAKEYYHSNNSLSQDRLIHFHPVDPGGLFERLFSEEKNGLKMIMSDDNYNYALKNDMEAFAVSYEFFRDDPELFAKNCPKIAQYFSRFLFAHDSEPKEQRFSHLYKYR